LWPFSIFTFPFFGSARVREVGYRFYSFFSPTLSSALSHSLLQLLALALWQDMSLSSLNSWVEAQAGASLLFLCLLTLLNAPFDWASLGLTRALLRRGLELGGWWPYLLALADAALATVIIALLALVMVIGVQAFDELAVHGDGGGAAVLPYVWGGFSCNGCPKAKPCRNISGSSRPLA
jgi:hypothetical protein